MKKVQNALIGGALAVTSLSAAATPMSGYDARSLAMGGTGTAAGYIVNASYYNPALLAAYREGEDFNVSFSFGVMARDEDNMLDAIDTFQANDPVSAFSNAATAYESAVSSYSGNPTIVDLQAAVSTEANALINAATNLTNDLNTLSNKPIDLGAVVGVNVTIPSATLGISVFGGSRGISSGFVTVAQADLDTLTTAVNTVTSPTAYSDLTGFTDPFAGSTLASTLTMNGGFVTEAGVSLATRIGPVAIGVTPKTVQVDAIEVTESIETADTDIGNYTTETFSDGNLDIGVAFDLGPFKVGMVGKNLSKKEYNLASGSKVVIEPQYRAGIAWDSGIMTLTMDQDLTENKGIITNAVLGDSQNTQYTSVGAEFDLALVQLRAGYRTNAADDSDNAKVLTAGVGFHFLVNLDIGVAVNDVGAEAIINAGLRW